MKEHDARQRVRVLAYEGCRDEKCLLGAKDEALFGPLAAKGRGDSDGSLPSKRDRKAYLVFERNVLPEVLEGIGAGHASGAGRSVGAPHATAVYASHVGMLRVVYDQLSSREDCARRVECVKHATAPYVRVGPPSASVDHVVILVTDSYCDTFKTVECLLDFKALKQFPHVTIIVARELLPGTFESVGHRLMESGQAFYRVFGEMLDAQNTSTGYGTGGFFASFEPRDMNLLVMEPELVRIPSIFDGLKQRRRRRQEDGQVPEDDEAAGFETENLVLEALVGVVKRMRKEDQGHFGDLRFVRELHLDELTGPSVEAFRSKGKPDGGEDHAVYQYAFGREDDTEVDHDTDYHARFDFSLISKSTGRLLLAIEVDGEPHRFGWDGFDEAQAKDRKKDAFAAKVGGLVLSDNRRDHDRYAALVAETSFTLLRLPTDGTTFYEVEGLDAVDGSEDRLTIEELVRDRVGQELAEERLVRAPRRVMTSLDAARLKESCGDLGLEDGPARARPQTRCLKALGIIQREEAGAAKGWVPTTYGRNACGATLALYADADGLHAQCLFPADAEERIARWRRAESASNPQ